MAATGDPSAAAIGSAEAAQAHGLVVLRHGIADSQDNYTRFVVLSAAATPVDVRIACKTSLILITRHEEGALLRCLEILSGSGHSMTKLESRPRPGRPWEYLFFLDFEGNAAEPRTAAALDELRLAAQYVKVLGSYPAKALRHPAHPGSLPDAAVAETPAETLEAVAAGRATGGHRSRQYRLVGRASRAADTLVQVADLLVGGSGFAVMAGPCSVENAGQIAGTAKFVRDHGAHVLRGGVFKPRTSPYAFQGLGWKGLELLAAAGREIGLPVVTEVMAVEQAQRMAKDAGILQIGAASTMPCSSRACSGPPRSAMWPAPCPSAPRTARARAAAPGLRTARTGSPRTPGLRHQRHQQHRPDRRRHRHRPPGGALDFPPRDHLRGDLADHAALPGHGVQLLLDHPEPGVVSGMASCLDPPVAAHHRRRDRHRLEEHRHLARADLPGSLRPSSTVHLSFPAPAVAAATAGQRPAPRRSPHPPGRQATRPGRQRQ